jgi:hypothetical protein
MTKGNGDEGAARWVAYGLAAAVLAASLAALFRPDLLVGPPRTGEETQVAPPPQVPKPAISRWKQAALRVEEDRGEPTGRAARVSVPAQLRHYADKRRFLAIQVAGWREQDYELPHDEAGLAALIRSGELVEVKPVTDDYVLYGVGANASDEPLRHYDRRTGREVTLYPRWDNFDDARAALNADIEARNGAIEALRAEFRKTSARTRAGRRKRTALDKQVRGGRAEVAAIKRRIAAEAAFWDDQARRRMLVAEWELLHQQAEAFGGREYDLERPEHRRAFRARLLSHIRPEALEVMEEIALAYRAEFGRPLAFTSLIRSEHYQRLLGESNANATKIAVPPHTTGLAFDIFYRYMTAAEQHSIMALIGRMESEGRLEALRENRDHYHLFAFAQGRRPPEKLIAEALGDVRPVRLASGARATVKKARTSSRGSSARKASARKATVSPRKTAPRARSVRKPTTRRQ